MDPFIGYIPSWKKQNIFWLFETNNAYILQIYIQSYY